MFSTQNKLGRLGLVAQMADNNKDINVFKKKTKEIVFTLTENELAIANTPEKTWELILTKIN